MCDQTINAVVFLVRNVSQMDMSNTTSVVIDYIGKKEKEKRES